MTREKVFRFSRIGIVVMALVVLVSALLIGSGYHLHSALWAGVAVMVVFLAAMGVTWPRRA